MTTVINVNGMMCPHCKAMVEKVCKTVPGTQDAVVDLLRFGLSGKEFDSVLRAVGGIDNLIDWNSKSDQVTMMKYMDDKVAKEDKVFDDPSLMKTPIVRNGKQATVGFCPEIWATWE